MKNENYEISPKLSDKMRNMSLFCAFLVVVIHCRPSFEAGTFGWWVRQFIEEGITRIAVPYFFVASGFFAAAKYESGGGGGGVYVVGVEAFADIVHAICDMDTSLLDICVCP